MKPVWLAVGFSLLASAIALAGKPPVKPPQEAAPIVLPGGEGGIGFDDLRYSPTLAKLLVPGGRSGRLNLVDPLSGGIVSIPGFSVVKEFNGGHDDGVTSVAEGAGLLFATDRTSEQLSIVYYPSRKIIGHVALSAGPDYVRWLESTRELWVTEPDSERIEIFHVESTRPPSLRFVTRIDVPGGPESLIMDVARGRAYTHVGDGKTAAIDLGTHAVVATFTHGCGEAKGMALDPGRGLLFVACEEGAVTTIDVASGQTLGTVKVGAGIDIIAYSPELGHVYVPSSETATVAFLGLTKERGLVVLGTVPGTKDSHCVAAAGKVFFADPAQGQLRVLKDPYPANPPPK
jgi:DNA-binding beta-propeller fold protein YncE